MGLKINLQMKLLEIVRYLPPGWTDGTHRLEYSVSISTLKDCGGVPKVITP